MGMYEKMFKGQKYEFDLTNNNNEHAFKFNKGRSVSTCQSGEFDRTISFKNTNNFIDLIYTFLLVFMTSKEDTIGKIYYNVVTGYGSVRDVYNRAKEKDSSITYKGVKQYMDKLNSRQVKFTYKKYNTYVPSRYLEELQCERADCTKTAEENDGYRYAFCAMCFLAMLGRYL